MRRLTALASMAALCLAAAAPVPAFADQSDYVQHQHDCMGLLFHNSEAHATECGGPFSLGPPKTIETPGSGQPCYRPEAYYSGAGEAQFLTVATCCSITTSAPLPEGMFGGEIIDVLDCEPAGAL